MSIRIMLILCTLFLTGCASVMNETLHPMKLETKTESGESIGGADCSLTNEYGTITVKSGTTTQVRRSGTDMDVVCKHTDNPDALARVISRANAGLYGNIIIGGGIGAFIDHSRGTAYTYPSWIQLIFGRKLVLDRASENEGQPLTGVGTSIQPKQEGTELGRDGKLSLDDFRGLLQDGETKAPVVPVKARPVVSETRLDDLRDLLPDMGVK